MTKRYIDIDSSFRNRVLFPNPSQFNILLSQSGHNTIENSSDPVSDAVITFPYPMLRKGETFDTYSWMYTTYFCDNVIQIDGFTSMLYNCIYYHPPQPTENIYVGSYIEDVEHSEYRRIIDYHVDDTPTVYEEGVVSSVTKNTITLTTPISDIPNYYSGKKIVVQNHVYIITKYTPPVVFVSRLLEGDLTSYPGSTYKILSDTSHFITIESSFSHPINEYPSTLSDTRTYRIRKNPPYESGTIVSFPSSNTFVLPSSSSSQTNFYRGMFLWMWENNTYYYIIQYDGSTRTGRTSHPIDTYSVSKYNILPFRRDNVSPLVYSGDKQQSPSCYDIELVNLILPNIVLSSGLGGRIAFYPYVYVEFSNVSETNSNVMYSNNPYTTRVVFKVPIDDVNTPDVSPFICISCPMVQTIHFNPEDNLKVSIRLPSGELFETDEKDYFSPSPPNPRVQISFTFCIQKVEMEFPSYLPPEPMMYDYR